MKFLRPVGAVRDVKELEYVVALHQTAHDDFGAWIDGSIDAADVKAFLMSRYGIEVSEDHVRETIFAGLAGGEVEADACLDMVEIMSILIIPLLVKVNDTLTGRAKDWEEQDEDQKKLHPPPDIVADVLHTILQDTLRGQPSVAGAPPPVLTAELLRAILVEYDELDVVADEELVRKMLAAARGGDEEEEVQLDVATFARALTSDINAYCVGNETKYSDIFSDIFDGPAPGAPDPDRTKEARVEIPGGAGSGAATNGGGDHLQAPSSQEDAGGEGGEGDRDATGGKDAAVTAYSPPAPQPPDATGGRTAPSGGGDVRIRSTLSQIDFTADSVYSWEHAVLVWLTIVFSYMFYVYGLDPTESVCGTDTESFHFWCTVANKTVSWILIMLRLVVLGSIVGISLSMGNGTLHKSVLGPVLGLVSVGIFVFFPAFYAWENPVFSSDFQDKGDNAFVYDARYILPAFGCILVFFQIKNLVSFFMDMESLPKSLRYWFLGSNGRAAFRSKQAGIYKVNQMVKRAYDLHKAGRQETEASKALKKHNSYADPQEESTKARALQNYSDSMDETEEVGGYFWAYKALFSGHLQETEGIWLSSRLMAAIAIMLVVVVMIFAFSIVIFSATIKSMFPLTEVQYSSECFSVFDANQCYFPYGDGFYTGVGVCLGVQLNGNGCLDLFDEVPTDSVYKEKSCAVLDEGYSVIAAAVPSNATCSSIFAVTEDIIASEYDQDALGSFNACRSVAMADEETLAFMDLNETTIGLCRNITANVYGMIGQSGGNLTVEAFDFCAMLYPTLTSTLPSACDRSLYRARETIRTYEANLTETEFCMSSLSYCTPNDDMSTATCVIGAENLIPFKFEGPTCSSYPDINSTMAYYEEVIKPTLDRIGDLMPAKWMVVVAAAIAIVAGFVTALASTLVYIPSSIHTLMKFRSGVLPSLRDPAFITYRKGLQDNAYLMGSMVWGLIVSTIFTVVLAFGSVFLLVWQETRSILLKILANVIGISVTVFLKMGFVIVFMKFAFAGYYRKKPIYANIFSFGMECWYLALTLAFIISRLAKFMLTTTFYVGRIDVPVLAQGLLLDMDSLPKVFRKNLLSTEAHRHPYIELLGLMYLMKLRHKENFGSAAGSAWRLLFVNALMPWLKKNRIQDTFARNIEGTGPSIANFSNEVFGGVIANNIG